MEEVARSITTFLFQSFGDNATGERACALIRVYKTHAFASLPGDLRAVAQKLAGDADLAPTTRCLALLASSGLEPAWGSRFTSEGHRAIPLRSVEAVARLPMVSQLITQLGFDVADVVSDTSLIVDGSERAFNVFYVDEARGSPYIPAQEGFVVRYGIRSVLGFGGRLPGGELFAVILFSRVSISRDTANTFKPLALATKLAFLPFTSGPVFEDPAGD